VVDDGRLGEAEVLARHLLGYRRMALRVAPDVQLVDDGVAPGHARRAHAAPVEGRVHDPQRGTQGALSFSSGSQSLPGSAPRSAGCQVSPPSIAVAQGSTSSLAGLKRWPSAGW